MWFSLLFGSVLTYLVDFAVSGPSSAQSNFSLVYFNWVFEIADNRSVGTTSQAN